MNPRFWFVLVPIFAAIGCWSDRPLPQSDAKSQAARQDAEALKPMAYRDWYDSARRDYRPPLVDKDPDHAVRRDGASRAGDPKNPTTTARRGFFAGIDAESLAYWILIVAGIALLGLAIGLLAVSIRGWMGPSFDERLSQHEIRIDPARVAELPFDAQSQMQDPLAYARQFMAAGDYDQAMLFLYGYMLLALDRAGKIALHRGKTNRMYLPELIGEPTIKSVLLPAMLAFEDVFFGRHSIGRDRFHTIWISLDVFHRELATAMAIRNENVDARTLVSAEAVVQ